MIVDAANRCMFFDRTSFDNTPAASVASRRRLKALLFAWGTMAWQTGGSIKTHFSCPRRVHLNGCSYTCIHVF